MASTARKKAQEVVQEVFPQSDSAAMTTADAVNLATAARLEQKATPGYQTTEFYFSALAALLAFILALVGKISFEVATGAITAAGVAYSIGRGVAKT